MDVKGVLRCANACKSNMMDGNLREGNVHYTKGDGGN